MNERIKELMTRSIDYACANQKSMDTAMEKFAELIVKECANIDFRHRVGLTSDDSFDISNVIREHFGVEE